MVAGKDFTQKELETVPERTDYYPAPTTEPGTGATPEEIPASTIEHLLFYYHPDYLGNVEYITDMDGLPYQYFLYTSWGETIKEEKAATNTWESPYRFNGKELDEETGLYYYGARYYNPQTSVWLSVDAKNSERAWLSPYQFVQNNPVQLVDPDGNLDEDPNVDLQAQYVNQGAAQDLNQNSSGYNGVCETCPKEEAYDLYRQSEVNFSYNENTQRVNKSDAKKLDMSTAKNPHLETLTFLKYAHLRVIIPRPVVV